MEADSDGKDVISNHSDDTITTTTDEATVISVQSHAATSYDDQLRSLFESCDLIGNGQLDLISLHRLITNCLGLEEIHAQALLQHLQHLKLLQNDTIAYDDFREGLVTFWEQYSANSSTPIIAQSSDETLASKSLSPRKRQNGKRKRKSVTKIVSAPT